jgi:hypothetical protein
MNEVKMGRYSPLPNRLREMLERVEPSRDGDLEYYPCRVVLVGGNVLDNVYAEPDEPYFKRWGVYPEEDPGKRSVLIDEVLEIESSPTRLPAKIATQIYDAGESGMGFFIFTVVFADSQKVAYQSGNAVDFIPYPTGKGPQDVIDVIPHEGRNDPSLRNALKWYWCLYSGHRVP